VTQVRAPDTGIPTTAASSRLLGPWALLLLGFAAMYAPLYWGATQDLWRKNDELADGPITLIILLLVVVLFWQSRERILAAAGAPARALGWASFWLGLLLYGFGRVLTVPSVAFASQVAVAAGGLLLLGGRGALKAAWFPVFYMLFTIPMPASLVDAVTGPLKHWISVIVVELLYVVGYPIARAGVTISIGPYQLLVADACSGLNSMFSLAAIGALFVYFKGRSSRLHNTIMVGAILPIAFVANIIRVITLSLITYHGGDEAGQGFLHDPVGVVLMVVALGILFALDALLATVLHPKPRPAPGALP
jgi:exosortase B